MSTHNTWGKNKTKQKATSAPPTARYDLPSARADLSYRHKAISLNQHKTLHRPSRITTLGAGEVLGNSKRGYP